MKKNGKDRNREERREDKMRTSYMNYDQDLF